MRKMIMMALAGLIWKQFQTKVMKRPPAPGQGHHDHLAHGFLSLIHI